MPDRAAKIGMCDEHIKQWNAWSDYRQVLPLSINSHAAYDDSVRGVMERRARLVAEWRETIRSQQILIKRICAKECSVVSTASEDQAVA